MARLIRIVFFLVLLTNSLTLRAQQFPFDVYTLDLALVPFALLVAIKPIFISGTRLRLAPFDWLFVLLMFLIVVSLLFSLNRQESLTNAMDWFRLVLIYFLARSILGSVLNERMLVTQFTIMALLLLALGLVQMITEQPIGIIADYFGERREQYGWYRVSGPTTNSNVFATWVIVYGGLSLSLLLAKARPFLFFVMAGVMSVVMIGTLSRGGALGFFTLLLVLAAMHSHKIFTMRFLVPASLITVCMMGLLFIAVVADVQPVLTRGVHNLINRHADTRDFEGSGKRWELIQLGLQLLERPKIAAVGCGAGGMIQAGLVGSSQSADASQRLISGGADIKTGVHNVWIGIAVENGIPAAVILLSIFVLFLAWVSYWPRRGEEARAWVAYLIAIGVLYLVVLSQLYLEAARPPILLPVMVLIAFAANGAPRMATPEAPRPDSDLEAMSRSTRRDSR